MVNTATFAVLDRDAIVNATPQAGRARQPMLQSIRSLCALEVHESGKRAADLGGLLVCRELSTKAQPYRVSRCKVEPQLRRYAARYIWTVRAHHWRE